MAVVGPTATIRGPGTKRRWLHWPAWLGSGAGDGNRTYRSEAADLFKSRCYEIAGALRAIIV